jgi:hypothetical protein
LSSRLFGGGRLLGLQSTGLHHPSPSWEDGPVKLCKSCGGKPREKSLALCDRAASEKWYTISLAVLIRHDVRFGSKADIRAAKRHVGFSPESGHQVLPNAR